MLLLLQARMSCIVCFATTPMVQIGKHTKHDIRACTRCVTLFLTHKTGHESGQKHAPGVTMAGLRRIPSNMTLLSAMYLKVSAQMAS